jgi:hypothetical protein
MTMTIDARRGYNSALVQAVGALDPQSVMGRFARLCIAEGVPATSVAVDFGVSRSMVYNWFKGVHAPRARHIERMAAYLAKVEGT